MRSLAMLALVSPLLAAPLAAETPPTPAAPHALFVWAGDKEKKGNDFLLVLDADPRSPQYGRMLTALATDQRTVRPHHTEYTMPESGTIAKARPCSRMLTAAASFMLLTAACVPKI